MCVRWFRNEVLLDESNVELDNIFHSVLDIKYNGKGKKVRKCFMMENFFPEFSSIENWRGGNLCHEITRKDYVRIFFSSAFRHSLKVDFREKLWMTPPGVE